MPFPDFIGYNQLVYSLTERYPCVQESTMTLVPIGRTLAKLEGQLKLDKDITLDVWELVDFDAGRILNYSYEIYQVGEKVAWYDPFAHPEIPTLVGTLPHHKHILPNLLHNRVPAPGISFHQPNLPFLIEEIERDFLL
jgi:hypothetical protein